MEKLKTLDLRGLKCPEPLKRTEAELGLINDGTIVILVEPPSNWNIERLAKKAGFEFEGLKKDGYWELKVTKHPWSRPKEGVLAKLARSLAKSLRGQKAEEKDILLVVGTDTMGKEEDIGKVLMKAYFETMKVTKELPHTIFFLNAGVRLTTINEEIAPILKEIEAMGVEVYSCGTCLKHYGLEAGLKVGHRGMTNHIVEGAKDFRKVIWIG